MRSAKCTLLRSVVPRFSVELPAWWRSAAALTRTLACGLAIAAGLLAASPSQGQENRSPDAALDSLFREARAALPAGCAQPGIDRLVRILCSGRIRIGVRDNYPLFSTRTGEARHGYEIDIAQAIARKLGVDIEFAKVNAASRIPMAATASTGAAATRATPARTTSRTRLGVTRGSSARRRAPPRSRRPRRGRSARG